MIGNADSIAHNPYRSAAQIRRRTVDQADQSGRWFYVDDGHSTR